MSLLTHRLVLLCVDAHCSIVWDLPGDVLAAPDSALCGWNAVIRLSLSLYLPAVFRFLPDDFHRGLRYSGCCMRLNLPGDALAAPASALCGWKGVIILLYIILCLY